MNFSAYYFDGKRSHANLVTVSLDEEVLSFKFGGQEYSWRGKEFSIHPPLAGKHRMIELNAGKMLEVPGGFDLPTCANGNQGLWQWIHQLENNLQYVAATTILVVATAWIFIAHGLPFISAHIVAALPLETESAFGKSALASLDLQSKIFQSTALSLTRQTEIKLKLEQLCSAQKNTCPDYQLNFRKSAWLGANAFALPGGILVVTDDLIALAENDQEIVSVLAHELGHVSYRHPMQQVVASSVSGIAMFLLMGDIESLVSGVPVALMQLHNSREMEYAGDTFALHALQNACIAPAAFANILARISRDKSKAIEQSERSFLELFSTHPDTELRVKIFKDASLSSCKSSRAPASLNIENHHLKLT